MQIKSYFAISIGLSLVLSVSCITFLKASAFIEESINKLKDDWDWLREKVPQCNKLAVILGVQRFIEKLLTVVEQAKSCLTLLTVFDIAANPIR